jgi:hypothetical protein
MAAQLPTRLRGRGTCGTETCTEFEQETSSLYHADCPETFLGRIKIHLQ